MRMGRWGGIFRRSTLGLALRQYAEVGSPVGNIRFAPKCDQIAASQYLSLWANRFISHCRKSLAAIARIESKADNPACDLCCHRNREGRRLQLGF
jgi:hypothetical protein